MRLPKKLRFRILQFNAVVKSNHVALTLYPKLVFHQLGTIPTGFLNKKHPDITFYGNLAGGFLLFVQAIRSNKSNQYSTKIINFQVLQNTKYSAKILYRVQDIVFNMQFQQEWFLATTHYIDNT